MNLYVNVLDRLQSAFFKNKFKIDIRDDYVVVKNSHNQTEERMRSIVQNAGFCPMISERKINGNFALTIVPYKIPNFFLQSRTQSSSPVCKSIPNITIENVNPEKNSIKDQHVSLDKIRNLLKESAFVLIENSEPARDGWSSVNDRRKPVVSSLNAGLDEILLSKIKKGNHPIVEIGSGIGYTLSEKASQKTIRTQPSIPECKLLKAKLLKSGFPDQIYHLDIEGLYKVLIGNTIPLFFALNVFDTMSPKKRKSCLSQLSQLQSSGNQIVIMLDINPGFTATIKHMKSQYPNDTLHPYLPLEYTSTKLSMIAVPSANYPYQPTVQELKEQIDMECDALRRGARVSQQQLKLHHLQKELSLPVIELETFYAKQIMNELNELGYNAKTYYHTTFTIGKLLKKCQTTGDLAYNFVTDIDTLRLWDLDDESLQRNLAEKGIAIPKKFNKDFLNNLRANNEKIIGSEILVIEATKRFYTQTT